MSRRISLHRGLLSRLGGRALAPLIALAGTERGSSLIELAVLLPVLSFLLLGVIDFGRAYYLSIEVANAAHAGALYGIGNTGDLSGMQTAATNDAVNVPGMTAVATNGCECSDFSASYTLAQCVSITPPTCTSPVTLVNYVQVTTSATYTTMFPWPGIPSSFALNGSAKIRAGQ